MKVLSSLLSSLLLATKLQALSAWTGNLPRETVSRREVMNKVAWVATAAASTVATQPAMAVETEARVTTRMGGLLEAFQDGGRGIRIMAPSGWNKVSKTLQRKKGPIHFFMSKPTLIYHHPDYQSTSLREKSVPMISSGKTL